MGFDDNRKLFSSFMYFIFELDFDYIIFTVYFHNINAYIITDTSLLLNTIDELKLPFKPCYFH